MAGEIELLPERALSHVVGHDLAGLVGKRVAYPQFRVLAASNLSIVSPLDTVENILATIVIPAHSMGPNGVLRYQMLWSAVNASVKTTRYRLGGISSPSFGSDSIAAGSLQSQRMIGNRNSEAIQIGGNVGGQGGWSTSSAAIATGTINTAVDQNFLITVQKATGADAAILEAYCIEVLYA